MRRFISLCIPIIILSCNNHPAIVEQGWVDDLIEHYKAPSVLENEKEIDFWRKRIDTSRPGLVNELKYAQALVMRYHLKGNLQDIKSADSILIKIDRVYNYKEASPKMALFRNFILCHRFREADSVLIAAKAAGLKKYESAMATFDIDLELGRYKSAIAGLKKMSLNGDYGFHFRNARMQHYSGNINASVQEMKKAVNAAGSQHGLHQVALSNEADLYMHAEDAKTAYDCFKAAVVADPSDLHSIIGIGWIALVHDKNVILAEKIFQFVRALTAAPEPLLKLVHTAQAGYDSIMEKKYAVEFIDQVNKAEYGDMYNKYLIELYTGILNDPNRAETIALRELHNRATPQTKAWLVWALYQNNKTTQADSVFYHDVSGKPLEAIELYWMGKFMWANGKKYDAHQFFTAAMENKYDLPPRYLADMRSYK